MCFTTLRSILFVGLKNTFKIIKYYLFIFYKITHSPDGHIGIKIKAPRIAIITSLQQFIENYFNIVRERNDTSWGICTI